MTHYGPPCTGWAAHRSMWEGSQSWSPFEPAGLAGGAHPPPNVSHVSPLSVACFPHRRGREGGKNKRHNNVVSHAPAQTANAVFKVACTKRATCLLAV